MQVRQLVVYCLCAPCVSPRASPARPSRSTPFAGDFVARSLSADCSVARFGCGNLVSSAVVFLDFLFLFISFPSSFFPYSTFISVSPRPPRKPCLNLTTSTSPTSFLADRLLPFISLVGTAFPLSMRYLLPSSYLHPYPKPCSPHSALPYPLVIRATHLTALHVLPFCANTSNELTHLHYTLLLILYTCSLRGKDASVARGVKA